METVLDNGFCDMAQDEMKMIDGGKWKGHIII
jgi:hypothetical protein